MERENLLEGMVETQPQIPAQEEQVVQVVIIVEDPVEAVFVFLHLIFKPLKN